MSTIPEQCPEETPTLPPGLPADWRLDRDLPCPQCRYNLRTLHTPRCPECGLVFRWQAVLQIGCPRCGEPLRQCDAAECPKCRLSLDWSRLLSSADPSMFKLYEYAEHPVRAAVRTWRAVLRPRRFWDGVPIELPPATERLRNYLIACLALGAIGWIAYCAAGRYLAWDVMPTLLMGIGMTFAPPVATAVMLPIFVDTLAKFRIRREHLLRCAAYGFSGMVWTGLAVILMVAVAAVVELVFGSTVATMTNGGTVLVRFPTRIDVGPLLMRLTGWRFSSGHTVLVTTALFALIAALAFVWWPYFLFVALRHYLRLDPANTVAVLISTQLAGVLVMILIMCGDDSLLRFMASWLI